MAWPSASMTFHPSMRDLLGERAATLPPALRPHHARDCARCADGVSPGRTRRRRLPRPGHQRRCDMARNGYLILDSDLHMMEPDDLWARYMEGPHRANLPRFFGGQQRTLGRN